MLRIFLIALAFLLEVQARPMYADSSNPPRLRVLTYNIHHGEGTDGRFDYARLAKAILDLKPGVVALQEVDRKTTRASGVDQAARLAELTKMQYAYGCAMHYAGGVYGEAILSRFPIEQVWVHALPYHFGQEPRAAIAVRVKPPNGLLPFIFVGTHLCHQSSETRLEQTKQLNLLFPGIVGPPLILAGDFNSRPGSPPIRELLDKQWIDAVAPKSGIDYVLFRKHDPWKVAEVTIVPDDVTSDHRPVLVVLEWGSD